MKKFLTLTIGGNQWFYWGCMEDNFYPAEGALLVIYIFIILTVMEPVKGG